MMNPAEDLLISFDNDPPSGLASPLFRNRLVGLSVPTKFEGMLSFSELRNNTKNTSADSNLYQPWWSQPIANSYPGSGTESPCFPNSALSVNITPETSSPPQSHHNLQEDKDVLIKKIVAHQEVLKRKLAELEKLRKDHEQGANDCQILKSYTENLLTSKAVRNSK